MTLAIMQPYIFPYIGYFQLIHAADKFVVYDDVSFIKQGWINRNNILLNGQAHMFTVPLKSASSFTTIGNTEINHKIYDAWSSKFLKTLVQAYAKAPQFHAVHDMLARVLTEPQETISGLASASLVATANYLGITTEIELSALSYNNSELKAQERILDICKQENAPAYVNPIGGTGLYSKDEFARHGIKLNFIKTHKISYAQFKNEFVPWLSVIDVMMFNTPGEIMGFLNAYDLE